MDQFYTCDQILMFTSVLRIGPFVILEAILLAIVLVIQLLETLPTCYCYTLSEMAMVFFLIEMYASLRIMKKSNRLRRQYIKERIEEGKVIFYCRMVWDNINVITIIMLFYSALVADGLELTSTQSFQQAEGSSAECSFSLFSICLFSQLVQSCSFSAEDTMIIWMLYAATTFLISVLCVIVTKEYYQYCASVYQNRKLARQYGEMKQALLDSNIYHISADSSQGDSINSDISICAICMHGLFEKQEASKDIQIVKLKCRHHFHEECIHKWLKVKDHCPYRCFLDQK